MTEHEEERFEDLVGSNYNLLNQVYDLSHKLEMYERREANYIMAEAPKYHRLVKAAIAVVERWDSPNWKDAEPTAKVMNDLRAARQEAER